MTRILPFPQLSVFLWLGWMLLNSWSWGHAILGLVLTVLLPLTTRPFCPNLPRLRNYRRLFRFIGVVLWDIVTANLTVAKLILGPSSGFRPGFFEMPLDVTDETVIAVLANTISLTPGTVSADVSEDRRTLLVHTLDLEDEQATIELLKNRYERALREIFEC